MFDIKEELKKLPEKPGVYIMRDEHKQIIYVGKAVVLKNRVRQYFQSSANHTPKVRAMVERIREFEYIVTDSELEALILECNLIKKHRPKYNILLKDDKNYPYIKVTMNEEYPRVLMTRKMEKDGARYFGPYSSAFAVKETLALLQKIFPLKTCSKVLPRDIRKERPCLKYYIYQCLAPCQGEVNRDEYRGLMNDICSFLNGRQNDIIHRLEEKMNEAAGKLDFERAAGIRDKINSLKYISEKQKVLSTNMEDQDVIAFAKDHSDSVVQVFFIRSGKLIGREHFIMEGTSGVDDSELMTSFVKQFYASAAYIPQELILQKDLDEADIIESWLTSKRGGRVYIKVPRKGDKLKLIDMVSQNAVIALEQFRSKVIKESALKAEGPKRLREVLGLTKVPDRIEAYDISNTGTSEMVASMVVFEDGQLKNSQYRRFKIKSQQQQNDYGSMQEVIWRRFRHAQKEMLELENNENFGKEGKFTRLPDLILLDGGMGHVNTISEVMNELKIKIPIAGMVKDDNHKTKGLVWKDGYYDLIVDLPLLRFITSIQDEAHRYALSYNTKLRSKRYSKSALDEIDGIGPKRKKALVKHFGSVSAVKAASIDDIEAVEGISKSVAEKIYQHFH